MLVKELIKLRMKSMKAGIIVVSAVMLVLGLLGLCAGFLTYIDNEFLSVLFGIGRAFISLGLSIATGAGTILIAYQTFEIYGSDMSYLYFTLPVKRSEIYKAGVVSYIYATLIIGAVGIVSYALYYIPTLNLLLGGFSEGIIHILGEMLKNLSKSEYIHLATTIVLSILMFASSAVFSGVSMNACAIFGCTVAKKHKLLGTILTYIVFTSIVSTVISIFMTVFVLILSGTLETFIPELTGALILSYVFEVIMVISIISTVIGSIICHKIAKKKLEEKLDIA